MTDLSVSDQWYYIVLAGAGVGLVLSPANTDALNRVPRSRYGEATGITQTVRNFGSSLGLAVLGSLLITREQVEPGGEPRRQGRAQGQSRRGRRLRQPGRRSGLRKRRPRGRRRSAAKLFSTVPHDFALASRTVFYGMAVAMAVAFVVALANMPGGKVEEQVEEEPAPTPPPAPPDAGTLAG